MDILAIGTAQFGLNYGIKNNFKRLDPLTIKEILDLARENKITTIDTAQGYGDSEMVLGNYFRENPGKSFKIITKINEASNVSQSVAGSIARLNQEKLYGVLVHTFSHYENDPAIFSSLKEIKDEQRVEKIGFSLYYPEELELLLDKDVDFDILQVAYSIFDRRFEKYFPILFEKNVEIHTRSVFLQGLFFLDPRKLGPHFDKVKDKLKGLHSLSETSGLSISALCLNFVANNPYINKIVTGIDNPNDLSNNLIVLDSKEAVSKYLNILEQFSVADLDILFPHFWKL